MKRKLDSNDVPIPVASVETEPMSESFDFLGLDNRLLQGIAQQGFVNPTPVQRQAIPLVLQGRDVLAQAKTGSGKTAAYVLPVLNAILKRKQSSGAPTTSALILVPTRELAEQVNKAVQSFASFCAKDVRSINLTQKVSDAVQRSLLADSPDIVIATPARAALNAQASSLSLERLSNLVIDEADLLLSYEYEEDLQNLAKILPKGVQTIMMSATLTSEVDTLKTMFCHDPVTLELAEDEADGGGLGQFYSKCSEEDKFLLVYVILKLNLIKGKCIIFVSDIDRCYHLKLFLGQFGIKSCILNSELPVNSRIHIVDEFNKNVYDIIIASDEHEILGSENDRKSLLAEDKEVDAAVEQNGTEVAQNNSEQNDSSSTRAKKNRKTAKRNKEYGVSRGIDFQNVNWVLNFDLPVSSKSYTHRIGRTARAGQTGMALSFIIPEDQYRKFKHVSVDSTKSDEIVLSKIQKHQAKKGKDFKPWQFDMAQIEKFRYRMGDALRAVTKNAIRHARTSELRQELIKSEKLKRHFEENPEDLHHLRHDGEMRTARIQTHLKHVPDYLLPQAGKKAITGDIGYVGIRKTSENRIRKNRQFNKSRGKPKAGRKSDPLKTFKAGLRM